MTTITPKRTTVTRIKRPSAAMEPQTTVEPFGEYVRRIFGLRSSTHLGNICTCVATLFILRSDPDKLKTLLEHWHSVAFGTCTDDDEGGEPSEQQRRLLGQSMVKPPEMCQVDMKSGPDPEILAPNGQNLSFDEFSTLTLSVIHECINAYCSTNWDKVQTMVQTNLEYNRYIAELTDECIQLTEQYKAAVVTHPSSPDKAVEVLEHNTDDSIQLPKKSEVDDSAYTTINNSITAMTLEQASTEKIQMQTQKPAMLLRSDTECFDESFSREESVISVTSETPAAPDTVPPPAQAQGSPGTTPPGVTPTSSTVPKLPSSSVPSTHQRRMSLSRIAKEVPLLTAQRLKQEEDEWTGNLVLLFHAQFSRPSLEAVDVFLKVLRRVEEAKKEIDEEIRLEISQQQQRQQPRTSQDGSDEQQQQVSSGDNSVSNLGADSAGSLDSSAAATPSPKYDVNAVKKEQKDWARHIATMEPPCRFAIINGAAEFSLMKRFDVQSYPTLVFLSSHQETLAVEQAPPPGHHLDCSDGICSLVPDDETTMKTTTMKEPMANPISFDNKQTSTQISGRDSSTAWVSPLTPHASPKIMVTGNGKADEETKKQKNSSIGSRTSSSITTNTTHNHKSSVFLQSTMLNFPAPNRIQKRFAPNAVCTVPTLLKWIASGGAAEIPEKKLRNFVTRLKLLDASKKFAAKRELTSAVIKLARLGCTSGCDGKLRTPTKKDPPRFIFLGGGMAAGKSTVVSAMTHSGWWQAHKKDIVLVEADEFKTKDPMFNAQSADLHEKSTRAASELLVMAINQGRDVVFDSTMMWAPYVEQTVHMIRTAHKYVYECGPGWLPKNNIERYWDIRSERPPEEVEKNIPYEIHIKGVFVDPVNAVTRGVIRQIITGRSVPVKAQLRSFKMFAENFDQYCEWVDRVDLYNNNVWIDLSKNEIPPMAAKKLRGKKEPEILDAEAYDGFLKAKGLNENATRAEEVF